MTLVSTSTYFSLLEPPVLNIRKAFGYLSPVPTVPKMVAENLSLLIGATLCWSTRLHVRCLVVQLLQLDSSKCNICRPVIAASAYFTAKAAL